MDTHSPLPSSAHASATAYDSTATVAEHALEEFFSLCQVPRPSHHTEKALAYLQSWADRHGLSHERDDYGNIWIDAPATAGYEHLPKAIVQGHIDMVCVANEGKEIDFLNEAITPVYNQESHRITADGTSLGADNGSGIAITLAIIASNVPHGPLRALITTDEEVGLLGAKAMSDRALDCDYLINLDNEKAGDICYSSAGFLRAQVNKKYTTQPLNEDDVAYTLAMRDLLGGHSGDSINKHRLHAVTYCQELLQKMLAQGLNCRLSAAKIGTAINVIPPSGKIEVVLPESQLAQAQAIFEAYAAQIRAEYPLELEMTVTFAPSATRPSASLSLRDTKELVEFIASLPQGVIQMKSPEVVRSSSNNGVFTLEDGVCSISAGTRSCVDSDLTEYESRFQAEAEAQGFEYVHVELSPGWDGNTDEWLTQLIKEGFEKGAGIPAHLVALHGGIELSWFLKKRPTLEMVCIGPTMENVHSPKEVLHTDSLEPVVAAILYALQHLGK